MTEPKKASEVILDIESKVNSLLDFFKNHDNNQKLIISRLDKIYKKIGLSESLPLLEENLKQEDNSFDFVEVKEKINPQDLKKSKKITVHQFVKYPKVNDKQLPVILAKVKIYPDPGIKEDPSLEELCSVVTNSNGMWEVELFPGKYFAHILKPKTNTKPQIDIYFDFEVSPDEKIKELIN